MLSFYLSYILNRGARLTGGIEVGTVGGLGKLLVKIVEEKLSNVFSKELFCEGLELLTFPPAFQAGTL